MSHSNIIPSQLQRIAIVGCCGGGKSTLAKQLSQKLNIPHQNLDDHFWYPNWVGTPQDQWIQIKHSLASQPAWIIDGTYCSANLSHRFQRADLIIFLDLPIPLCFFRILKRDFKSYSHINVTLPKRIREANPKPFINFSSSYHFYKHIFNFKRKINPLIQQAIIDAKAHRKVIKLNSSRQIKNFLDNIQSHATATANNS